MVFGAYVMKPSFKFIGLLSILVFAFSACTKKNTSSNPAKKDAAATKLTDQTKKDLNNSNTSPTPLPEPIVDEDQNQPASDVTPEPTDSAEPTASPKPAPTTAEPELPPVVVKPPATSSQPTGPSSAPVVLAPTPTTEGDAKSVFKSCLEDNIETLVGTIKAKAPREPAPADFVAIKNTLIQLCQNKLGEKAKDVDMIQMNVSKMIVLESLRKFPSYEGIIKFFNAIEDNTSFSVEQKNKIYSAYGSGGEITSKGLQFFGKIEGSKASPNAISYAITNASGTRTLRVFTGTQEIKKTVLDLKTAPKTNNRYIFDFTANAKNIYVLTISDGESKISTNVSFIKGDVKALREHQTVTVALTLESWSKVQEEHLRRLISKEAKDLITMPFSLEREQQNMALVRTCSLNAENIACSDPDFVSRAIVKPSSKVK